MKKEFHISIRFIKKEGGWCDFLNIFKLKKNISWERGDVLQNGKVARNSYCVCAAPIEECDGLSDALLEVIDRFSENKIRLMNFIDHGGGVEVFITFDYFLGSFIDSTILKSLGDLGISLSLDRIYYGD